MVAFSAAVFLLSLAGIPLTAGFFAKYYMLAAAVKAGGILWLVIAAVLLAAVSVYYYFRVIQSMYFKAGTPEWTSPAGKSFVWTLLLLAALLIYAGLFPTAVLKFIYF
jgi:NADH-quinone oxidoreductase subunit N